MTADYTSFEPRQFRLRAWASLLLSKDATDL
jgi:hypothetical protein